MSYKVIGQAYEELSDAEKLGVSNNGSGKEDAFYIRVTYKGKTIRLESDAMEPEDATFGRDLGWIKEALEEAYELGKLQP